ncbi:ABC transporter substrate-binding protein [Methanocella arvoryzae]|uniref:ABC-type sulfonate import system,periplasmic component n=1 Tax=Methanocella arvoryzae (strain DSM 22066 / NBRC 105507 / MRE50) TaxID=351160 RepID=Q0W6W4_METAR|nr:ABC transporter substrate-binding protein [Methanocella arvoryzae]CAJ35879.1 putative ABC-type sulfonate import system,periplasmic component [Methanocella arvoryzae MRE50]
MALDELFDKVQEEKTSRRNVLKMGIGAGIAVIGGASLAGCTTPTPTGTPGVKDLVKIGWMPTDHHAPAFIASTKKFFENRNINVEFVKFTAGPQIMQQVVAGNIDIGMAGVPPVLAALDKDSTVKIVGAVHNNGSALFFRKGLGIKSVADLKGMEIAVPSVGSIQDIMLREQLQKAGLDYTKDVSIKAPMPGGDMIKSLETEGGISAAIMWEPFATMAVQQGAAEVLLWSEDMMPGHPCDTITTTTGFIENYPESLKAFLQAHQDGVDFIKSNFDEAAEIVGGSEWLNSGKEVELEALKHMTFMTKPDETFLAGTETFARKMKDLGILKNDHTRADIFDLNAVNSLGGGTRA